MTTDKLDIPPEETGLLTFPEEGSKFNSYIIISGNPNKISVSALTTFNYLQEEFGDLVQLAAKCDQPPPIDDCQDYLNVLYKQRLAEAAVLNEKGNVSCVWFFIEHWKLKAEEPLISLLSEFQEQMKRISPELENYSFERPSLSEKPSPGAGDGAALREFLSEYQQKKEYIQSKTFDEVHLQPEKRRQLQHTAYLLVDRIDEHQSATDHKIEQFLSLVGLRELFIRKGHTRFHEDLHNTIDRRESSLEPGTIIEVTKRGFLDKTTGDIIRKAFVITAE